MSGTNAWKARIWGGLRAVKRLLTLPLRLHRYVENAQPARVVFKEHNRQYRELREANAVLHRLIAEMLPRLQQDVRAGREDVARLANEALPDMRGAADESREEVRRLKHRYAEFYGGLVEQLREQNRRLDRLEQILRPATDVLPLENRLPQAG